MQEADDMVLFKLQAKLVLSLAEKELDECILVYNQILPLLLLVNHLAQEWHHILGQRSDFVMLRESLYNLH